jgi:hypothetical protein
MHQDAFIWPRRNLGDIGLADYFRHNITQCSTAEGNLRPDVADFWHKILQETYPEDFQREPPNFSRWNRGFKVIVDTIDDAGTFVPFTRHLLASVGAAYPRSDAVDMTFIDDLATPEGPMHYSDVFGRAVDSVVNLWSEVGRALNSVAADEVEERLAAMPNGNLDTGIRLDGKDWVFWGVA